MLKDHLTLLEIAHKQRIPLEYVNRVIVTDAHGKRTIDAEENFNLEADLLDATEVAEIRGSCMIEWIQVTNTHNWIEASNEVKAEEAGDVVELNVADRTYYLSKPDGSYGVE